MSFIRHFLALFLCFFVLLQLNAQKETNHWYFGNYAALDFNSGTPVALTNSAMYSIEACASISDANGNLLFYTNGATVYSANHTIMQNGSNLLGNLSATQGALIVKQPGTTSLYYLFTIDGFVSSQSLYYHIIDMSANGGLGSVITSNVLVYVNTTEKQTAVRHQNGTDIWILSREFNSNQYRAYLLSSSGLSTTPVLSPSSVLASSFITYSGHYGQMKSSVSGSLVGAVYYNTNYNVLSPIEILDFDNSTGLLTNSRVVSNLKFCYGLEFSPNEQFFYITGREYSGTALINGGIYQYDLSTPTASAISNSQISITNYSSNNWAFSQLQLAIDGKIYSGNSYNSFIFTNNYIGRIENPNSPGINSIYQDSVVYLNGKSTTIGLPNIPMNLYWQNFIDSNHCHGDTTTFTLINNVVYDSVLWNFGDSLSGLANLSSDTIGLHTYTNPGTYQMSLVIYRGSVSDTLERNITIFPVPLADLGPDTVLCEGDSVAIQLTDSSFQYIWNSGDSSMQLEILQPDTYSITVSNVCGIDIDTLVVDSVIEALVHLPNDTILCPGESLSLDATVDLGSYIWSTGSTDSSITVDTSGYYGVTASNLCGFSTDSILVGWLPIPEVNLGNDSAACLGGTVMLDVTDSASTYLWSTNSTNSSISVNTAGVYWAEVTNFCGFDRDSIELWFLTTPIVNLGNDTVVCVGESFTLYDSVAFANYTWSTGDTTDSIQVNSADTYFVTVDNGCGLATDSIIVWYEQPPQVDLGPDGIYCATTPIQLNAAWSRASYLWNTNATDSVITPITTGEYYVQVTNLCGSASDTISIEYDAPLQFSLGNDTSICSQDSILLYIPNWVNTSFSWNTGNTSHKQWAFAGNTYAVTASNACGSKTELINIRSSFAPLATPLGQKAICAGEDIAVEIEASNFFVIRWYDGDTSVSKVFSKTGSYPVNYRNVCGIVSDTFNLVVDDIPAPNLGKDTILCSEDELTLYPNLPDGFSYEWSDGSTDDSLLIHDVGEYHVVVTSEYGCEGIDHIVIKSCGGNLFIPSAFTPNGDNLNDDFQVIGNDIVKFEIHVFDRWGSVVFSSTDMANSWNGKFQNSGEKLNNGAYAYRIQYRIADSEQALTKMGSVQIIR